MIKWSNRRRASQLVQSCFGSDRMTICPRRAKTTQWMGWVFFVLPSNNGNLTELSTSKFSNQKTFALFPGETVSTSPPLPSDFVKGLLATPDVLQLSNIGCVAIEQHCMYCNWATLDVLQFSNTGCVAKDHFAFRERRTPRNNEEMDEISFTLSKWNDWPPKITSDRDQYACENLPEYWTTS